MRVIRIGERYSISTDEVETYDLLPIKTYNYRTNLYEERGYDWITMQTKQGASAVDVKFEKHHLHYDIEKGAVVIPGDLLLLDYDDYEDDVKIEKSTPKYLAFVKSKKDSVHYIV